MPHIGIKMLKGRSKEQKQKATDALVKALCQSLGVSEKYVSVTVEDYTAQQWQDIYKQEITEKDNLLYKKPGYKAEDLL